MKKLALVLALMMCFSVLAIEEAFDGSVYSAYKAVLAPGTLDGWDEVSYIEPSGLLLSAYKANAELTISLEESDETPQAALERHVNGVVRYGTIQQKSQVSPITAGHFTNGAYVSYSYRSKRDTGSGDVYYVDMVGAMLSGGRMLMLTETRWGKDAGESVLLGRILPAFSLETREISTEYKAFLKSAEEKSDGIYVTIDYCDMEYGGEFGVVFANNDDPTEYTCRLSRDCEIWLGQQVGGLYAIKQITPDAAEISIAIESYYNQNLVEPIYTVLFNRAGEIVRLMHYNAL
ncbi:MAG: hypothetical protein IKI24_06795 [Clostridia bacterium]|nr:hypothetical protein [Clostridia bacterium]MCR4577147.1 hypothetical protein [Clostridiales bacterium]